MTSPTDLRPRNRAAVLAFGLWLAGLVIAAASVVIAVASAPTSDDLDAIGVPLLASFAYCPLFLIGIIAAVTALTRAGQPKLLAVIALLLNAVFFLVAVVVFTTAVQFVAG